MSDDYTEVRSQAEALRERFVDLEVLYQADQAYNDAVAQQHGGDPTYDDFDWTDEEKARRYSEYDAEFRGEIETWFADLTEIFSDLADLPDPAQLTGVATSLEPALTQLSGEGGHIDLADGREYPPHPNFDRLPDMVNYLVDWNGLAADAFKSNYLPPLNRVVHHEFRAVASLRSSMLASAEMWKKARKDVSDLIDETNSALDDYEGGKNPADAVLALSIIGAIVAIAAVPATGGTSAALYWAMAGSALSVTGAVLGYPDEPKKEIDIKGDSPAEICQSMRDAIADMNRQWAEDEAFIRDQLLELNNQLDISMGPSGTGQDFVVPRPALADTTRDGIPDAFGTPEI